jgi:DNA-binding XRE family transcriptional regulator
MIYNRIATIRTERGISRKDLADKVNVNYQTIGFIERGDYAPSLELAFDIAAALEVDIRTVFSDKPFTPIFGKEGESNES